MAQREQLFADIDSMEPERFAAHLAPDAVMRFGNAEPVRGRAAVRDTWAQFCRTVAGVHHDLVEQWQTPSATVVESNVTYTRHDGSQVTVPVVTIYREGEGGIADYRVFIDLAPLLAHGPSS